MERSRFRTLLGIGLIVLGVIFLSHALARSMIGAVAGADATPATACFAGAASATTLPASRYRHSPRCRRYRHSPRHIICHSCTTVAGSARRYC